MLHVVVSCALFCCVLCIVCCCVLLCAVCSVVGCVLLYVVYKLLPSPLSGDGVPHELLQCVCVRQGGRVSVSANCVWCASDNAHVCMYVHI